MVYLNLICMIQSLHFFNIFGLVWCVNIKCLMSKVFSDQDNYGITGIINKRKSYSSSQTNEGTKLVFALKSNQKRKESYTEL